MGGEKNVLLFLIKQCYSGEYCALYCRGVLQHPDPHALDAISQLTEKVIMLSSVTLSIQRNIFYLNIFFQFCFT